MTRDADFVEYVCGLAETSTSTETPGVARDPEIDALILAARRIQRREGLVVEHSPALRSAPIGDKCQPTEEGIARVLCKAEGTAQCAALCLSHSSLSTMDGQCPEARHVWGHKARAVVAALTGGM